MQSDNESEKRGIYDTIDSCVMYGVNKGVQVWNWTTGGTKTDLARILNIAGYMLAETYTLMVMDVPITSKTVISFAYLSSAYLRGRDIKKIDALEIKAREDSLMDMQAEEQKNSNGIYGTVYLGLSTLSLPFPKCGLLSAASFSLGLGMHAMRADYLPPKKNCLSRAVDNLVDAVNTLSLRPATSPVGKTRLG